MPAATSECTEHLTLREITALAVCYDVPIEDALLIAVNLFGIASEHRRHRARVTIRLTIEPEVPWMVIVPLNAVESPFSLRGEELSIGADVVGQVRRSANSASFSRRCWSSIPAVI